MAAVPWRNWKSVTLVLLVSAGILYVLLELNFRSFSSSIPVTLPGSGDAVSDVSPSPANILIVSALFPLSKSKHSFREYQASLSKFLGSITTPIYFFTTPEMAPLVLQLRRGLPITVNATFSSPFDVPPLRGLNDSYEHMWSTQDREKDLHSPELYAVWNSKPYLLDQAIRNSALVGKTYHYAFWNDADSFRHNHLYTRWPDSLRVQEVFAEGSKQSDLPKDDLLFFPMSSTPTPSMRFWVEAMGPIDTEFSEGTFFGGSPRAIEWWQRTYYAYHNSYLSQDVFVGKDQTLVNALFLLFPRRIITVWGRDPAVGPQPLNKLSCGDIWFYYQFHLSDSQTQSQMIKQWNHDDHWWPWDWFSRLRSCRPARTQWMLDVLKGRFGAGWNPPDRTLEV